MGYRIAEVAERTGIPATTIRFYEGDGVLATPARSASGYRVYDDRDLERLRFVGHARGLGLPIAALRDLVEAWEDGDCEHVAVTLRRFADDHLADLHRRIGELTALTRRVSDARATLKADAHDGPCGDGCVCSASLATTERQQGSPVLGDDADRAAAVLGDDAGRAAGVLGDTDAGAIAGRLGCELPGDEVAERTTAWRWLLGHAAAHEPTATGYRVRFPPEPALAAEVAALAAAEHACCSVLTFTMQVRADALHLDVTAPPEAVPLLAGLFGDDGAGVVRPTSRG